MNSRRQWSGVATNHRHVSILLDIPDPGPWWIAHDFPERPVDDYCVWSWNCTPCMLHLIAAVGLNPDRASETFTEHSRGAMTVGETLRQAREWRAEQGLAPL